MVLLRSLGDRGRRHRAGRHVFSLPNIVHTRENAFVIAVSDAGTRGGLCGHTPAEHRFLGFERQRTTRRSAGFESFGLERQRTVHRHRSGIERRRFGGFRAVERIADFRSGGRRRQSDGERLGEQAHVLRGIGNRNHLAAGQRMGRGRIVRPAFVIGARPERKVQLAALHQLVVGDVVPVDRLPVERHRSDIDAAARIVGRNGQRTAVGQPHDGFRELGRGQREFVRAGTYGIEAQTGEDVPCRHLAAVLVADDAFGRRGVHLVQQAARQLLRLPRLSHIIIKVSHMVARLVAVGVLPHQPRHVAHVELHFVRFEREEPVHFADERLAAAEKLDQAVHVVRHEEAVVPRCGLGIVAARSELFERRGPVAVGLTAAEKADRAVENIHIVERPPRVFPEHVVAAHSLRHAGDRPVVVGVFQRTGDRFALDIGGNIPLRRIIIRTFLIDVRRTDHRLQRLVGVIAANSLQIGVGDDRHGMVADHRARLARSQRPDREFAR